MPRDGDLQRLLSSDSGLYHQYDGVYRRVIYFHYSIHEIEVGRIKQLLLFEQELSPRITKVSLRVKIYEHARAL